MIVASCIVDVPARSVDRAFDYLVPEDLASVEVGCAVSVEFGNRPVVAYVVRLARCTRDEYAQRDGAAEKLKPLVGILSEPYFDVKAAELARWIAREYLCPVADALKLFTPPGGSPKMKRVDGAWTLVHPGVGPVDDRWAFLTDEAAGFEPAANASKQRKVMEALASGGMRVPELSLEIGQVNATLKALEKRGIVRIEHRRRVREACAMRPVPDCSFERLTSGQGRALDAICGACASATASGPEQVVVVDGITGSGKTEVYLRAIQHALDAGRGAIVLVPEIALTPQTVGRFRARFGQTIAVLHSKLSTGERFDQWDLVRSGAVNVAVGTRSALFAPVKDLGLVIIDEEHESSYKQDSAPRYLARDVALKMCRLHGAALVLGSATPSIETLAACGSGSLGRGWKRVELTERPGGQALPAVTVVDMGKEFKGGSRSMFSKELVDALLLVHERREKAVMLLNRRGFASFVLCRECGYVPECPDCAVSLTYHERGNMLMCHHCEHSEPVPARCPKCSSPYLRKFGAGTERVEAELKALLPPGMPVIRMDADTVRGKGGHARVLEEFGNAESAVLLGTQMIAKGLDYPDVTLVGVVNADTTLRMPDYRAPERTYQLLEQVSGRAGRADKPGRVIVQTYWPEHPAILAAAAHDRSLFLDEELPLREELGYPPSARLANILVWGKSEGRVRQVATEILLAMSSVCEAAGRDWSLLGPAPCVFSKLKGVYRWHVLVKAPPREDFAQVIGPVLAKRKRKRGDDTRVAVDVDPFSLL